MMDEYKLEIRVKNNLLLTLMEKAGIQSQSELARALGVPPTAIGRVANLREGAFNADGRPSSITQKMCDFFCCLPEDIYPKEVLMVGIPKNVTERVVSSEEVAKYIAQEESNFTLKLEQDIDTGYMRRLIDRLKPKEKEVIVAKYFNEMTYEECGQMMDLSRERVRQIEGSALRRFRDILKFETKNSITDQTDPASLVTRLADAQTRKDKMNEDDEKAFLEEKRRKAQARLFGEKER